MRRLLMALAIGSGALVAGCGTHGRATYAVSAGYAQPELAYVSPGVYVVADYNQPVFYADNSYWRYNNGRWFASNYYDRGWRSMRYTPRALMSIQRPSAYVGYRPSTRYIVRGDGRVQVRDHRGSRHDRRDRRDRRFRR